VAAARARRQVLIEEGRVPLRFDSRGHYCHVFRWVQLIKCTSLRFHKMLSLQLNSQLFCEG
jgi:hypothetical protein